MKENNTRIETMPHNGERLRRFIEKNHLVQASVARKMGVTAPSLQNYYKSQSLQMSILWKASQATEHNFLAEFGALLPVGFVTLREKELLKEVNDLQRKVDKLSTEAEIYKRILKI